MRLPLALWLHDIDKIALHVPWLPNGGIAWYGLSYLAGFVVAWLLLRRVMTAGATPLGIPFAKEAAGDLVMTCAIGVMLGGRLGYCVFYEPHLWVEFSKDLPFWGVLAIQKGGMASHGGMIGAALAVLWWGRRNRVLTGIPPEDRQRDNAQSLVGRRCQTAWRWLRRNANPGLYLIDLIAFAAPLGLCFGRLANFVNGELYGRACDKSYQFAMLFPQEVTTDWLRPGNTDGAQKYAALQADLGQAHLLTPDGRIPDELGLAAKTNPQLADILRHHLTPRHPSQLYAAAAEGLMVFLILFIAYRKPRKPGLIAGLFALAYTAARVGDEFFRMPDAEFIHGEKLPLVTQGQLLSFFLLAAGLGLLAWAWKSRGERLGGWGRGANELGK